MQQLISNLVTMQCQKSTQLCRQFKSHLTTAASRARLKIVRLRKKHKLNLNLNLKSKLTPYEIAQKKIQNRTFHRAITSNVFKQKKL